MWTEKMKEIEQLLTIALIQTVVQKQVLAL